MTSTGDPVPGARAGVELAVHAVPIRPALKKERLTMNTYASFA